MRRMRRWQHHRIDRFIAYCVSVNIEFNVYINVLMIAFNGVWSGCDGRADGLDGISKNSISVINSNRIVYDS